MRNQQSPWQPRKSRPIGLTKVYTDWSPPAIRSIQDTGLNLLIIADLLVKVLYTSGMMTGYQMAATLRLPYNGVVNNALDYLKRDKFLEVRGTGGLGEGNWEYVITSKGQNRAREILERSQYAGPCPVPLADYIAAMKAQNQTQFAVGPEGLKKALAHLVIPPEMIERIGPAVNSSRSLFLHGPPGNGKTAIAEAIGTLVMGSDIWIPYAIDIDGQTVQVFDNVNHEIVDTEETEATTKSLSSLADPRWLKIRRPVIIVGGELTMDGLDLVWDDTRKFYEAPYQVKANGGMFLVDDFGRQLVRPQDLLNRWIVPLEKQVDFLTLHTGRKIEMPFFVMIVFSTNLKPSELVDEAFLRRIRHKIAVQDPSFDQFRQIFRRVCEAKEVPYDDVGLKYLIKEWYLKNDRPLRAVHPRDLVDHILDIARYLGEPPRLSKELIDHAAKAYFVDM